jgi:sulfoxide reductase catalytic subunit YedY
MGASVLVGDMSKNPRDEGDMRIASADRMDEPQSTGAEGESADMVYEATKNLHETGIPQDINIATWRLKVEGDKVDNELKLSYRELKQMSMVKKEVTLVCPGFFTDVAVWEGVPLEDVLKQAQIQDDYERIVVHGADGYRSYFSPEEVDSKVIFLALKVNGVILPKEHGYPLRIVAEDVTGGKWVKWIESIEVE